MQITKTLLLTTLIPHITLASPLDSPASPEDINSAMYSIWDVCKRLDTGADGAKTSFQDATAAPAPTGCSLNDIMNKAPAKDAKAVTPNEVAAGKKYWSLTNYNWGLQTGTAPIHGSKTYIPKATDQNIAAGYYQAGVVKGDPNFKPENIRAGVTIFGVVGSYGSSAPQTSTPTAGSSFRDTLKDGSSGPEMVVISAGTFRLGYIVDKVRGKDRIIGDPNYKVSVEQFAMGKFPVTVGEFRKFVDATQYQTDAEKQGNCKIFQPNTVRGTLGKWTHETGRNWHNLPFSQDDNHPVVCVSWNDANAYTEWLSNQTGKKYRLPTEAEWEYAAKAGTETKYWWGYYGHAKYANYGIAARCCRPSELDNWKYTSPLGSFPTNQFGLYDMLGNVHQLTCSQYEYQDKAQQQECINKNTNKNIVIRGSSWGSTTRVSTISRSKTVPNEGKDSRGFRIVRVD